MLIKWFKMFQVLRQNLEGRYKDTRFTRNLYKNGAVVIQIGNEREEANIRKGVKRRKLAVEGAVQWN